VSRAIVERAYGPYGPVGWDVLIEQPDGRREWSDRTVTRIEARERATQWNQEHR
jgi:hypothetical protein